MSFVAMVAIVLLAGCGPAPPPLAKSDATKESWYGESVKELIAVNREAVVLFEGGKPDQAAALIEKGQPLMKRLLSVPRPTFEAVRAASELDHLYGRMLLSNRHYGWARMLFQKNVARWKNWTPQSEETARLLQQAESAIVECDRRMVQ